MSRKPSAQTYSLSHRVYKNLDSSDPGALKNPRLSLKPFTPEETRQIVFKTMLDSEVHRIIQLERSGPADYRSVVAFFARQLLKDLRLDGGYDVFYGKVKTFMREFLSVGVASILLKLHYCPEQDPPAGLSPRN